MHAAAAIMIQLVYNILSLLLATTYTAIDAALAAAAQHAISYLAKAGGSSAAAAPVLP